MDSFTLLLLIVIGALVLCVTYLQLRLSSVPRPAVVVMPQVAEDNSGCAVAVVMLLLVIALIILAVLLGLPAIG